MRTEKLKILPASLREKHRYIKFQVISQEPIAYSDLEAAIWNVALDFLGEHGIAQTGLWVIKNLYDETEQMGVIRCNNKSVQQVIASLALISRLGDTRIVIKILKVSGTIRGLG